MTNDKPPEISVQPGQDTCNGLLSDELPEIVWKSQYVETRIAGSILPIIYDDVVIVSRSGDLDPPDELVAFNKHTGEHLWTWLDYFSSKENLNGDEGDYYVYDGKLVITSTSGFYVIDVMSGKTVWRKKLGGAKWGNYGSQEFVYYSEFRGDHYAAVRANLNTHDECVLYQVPKVFGVTASFSNPYPVGTGSVVFVYNDYHFTLRKSGHVIYSVDAQCENSLQYEWKRVIDSPGGNSIGPHKPARYGENIYLGGSEIYCLNIHTGEVKWDFDQYGVGLAGMIMADDKLIIGTEGFSALIYGLDPDSGELLWNVPYGGNANQLQLHNCLVYTVSGGDGLLHVVDTRSGQKLYEMESPDLDNDRRLSLDNCAVDPETNRIYLTNFRYLMCYALPEYD